MSVIKVDNLTYCYGKGTPFEKKALDGVGFEIEKGELVAVLGHTGSGKSTLISHFNALIRPDSGTVYLNGVDIFAKGVNLRDVRFKVGVVFQYPEYQLFEETVYKDIAFGPKNMGLEQDEIDRRVRFAAQALEIKDELLSVSPFELSGGQKRKVAIAGVIAMDPEVLVLDEPAAGLDPRGRENVMRLISGWRDSTHNTVVIVSHSMQDAARYADKAVILDKGRLFFAGKVNEAFSKAEELEQIGLSLPPITYVINELNKKGFSLPADIYTPEAAAEAIALQLKGGGKK